MAVVTLRKKNQVTLPGDLLVAAGLRQGDPVEFQPLADGGIAVRPYGWASKQRSALDMAVALAAAAPGAADVEFTPARIERAPAEADV